ncbi:MAG: hypothetical protein KGV51_03530 [Moraxellaceae bacterium]|nr:hypothetical protein [Moraxellaceae bacterium]
MYSTEINHTKSTNLNQIIHYYQELPPLAQNQALDFLEFLFKKQKLTPKAKTWQDYLKNRDTSTIPMDFMENREQPVLQTRSLFESEGD